MKKVIKKLDVIQTGRVIGLIYFFISLVLFLPFILIFSLSSIEMEDFLSGIGIGGMALLIIPVIYGVLGFLGGMVIALVYNLISHWIGGLVVEVEEVK